MQAIKDTRSLSLLGSRRMCFIWKGEIYYSALHINVLEGIRGSDLYFVLGMEAAWDTCPGSTTCRSRHGERSWGTPSPQAAGQQRAVARCPALLWLHRGGHTVRGPCPPWSVKPSDVSPYLGLINSTAEYGMSLAEQFLQC